MFFFFFDRHAEAILHFASSVFSTFLDKLPTFMHVENSLPENENRWEKNPFEPTNSTFRNKNKKRNVLLSFCSKSISLHFAAFHFVSTSLKVLLFSLLFQPFVIFLLDLAFSSKKKLIFLSQLCFKEFYQKNKVVFPEKVRTTTKFSFLWTSFGKNLRAERVLRADARV